jgi:hypothetical protein
MRIFRLSEVTFPLEWRELTPEEVAEAYRLGREAFTARDLQRYTETDEGVPMEEFLAELVELERQPDQEKK